MSKQVRVTCGASGSYASTVGFLPLSPADRADVERLRRMLHAPASTSTSTAASTTRAEADPEPEPRRVSSYVCHRTQERLTVKR